MHVFEQMTPGRCGGGRGRGMRGPQSAQSVPYWQYGYSEPGPPSSHNASSWKWHVSEHRPGAKGGLGGVRGGGGGCEEA